MKTIGLLLLSILFFNSVIISQDIIYSEIEKELSEEQKGIFDEAVLILQKATGNENNADAIDYKYRKKRKSSKWELKTWEAKAQRITAERNYQQAYSMISNVYSSIITNSKYESAADKTEALNLNKEAEEQFDAAKGILSKFKDLSQLAMANTNYEMLMTDLGKSHELKIKGIKNQIAALRINREKVDSNIDEQDLAAWEKAISTNTVTAYHEYLNNNPRGKYMSKANDRIRQLEVNINDVADNNKTNSKYNPRKNSNKNNKNPDDNNNTSSTNESNNTNTNNSERNETNTINYDNLIFKVQIAASKTSISDWTLMHKAPGADLIEEYRTSIWVKYMVGKFNTYAEAAAYRDQLRSTAPDAFIVVFEKGKQKAITEQMKL